MKGQRNFDRERRQHEAKVRQSKYDNYVEKQAQTLKGNDRKVFIKSLSPSQQIRLNGIFKNENGT